VIGGREEGREDLVGGAGITETDISSGAKEGIFVFTVAAGG
jgi:hypothetical protein